MKRIIFICCFSMFCIFVYSQSRLGLSASEIKSEFINSSYNLTSGYDNDGDYYISIETDRATVYYYFNTNKYCISTIIIPDNQGALNYYVEKYNNNYVIISSTKWKMYSENSISTISLIYPEKGGYYFMWE